MSAVFFGRYALGGLPPSPGRARRRLPETSDRNCRLSAKLLPQPLQPLARWHGALASRTTPPLGPPRAHAHGLRRTGRWLERAFFEENPLCDAAVERLLGEIATAPRLKTLGLDESQAPLAQ